MSVLALKEFIIAVQASAELQGTVRAAIEGSKDAGPFCAIGRQNGYEFTIEEATEELSLGLATGLARGGANPSFDLLRTSRAEGSPCVDPASEYQFQSGSSVLVTHARSTVTKRCLREANMVDAANRSFYIDMLGCEKRKLDSERIIQFMKLNGYAQVTDDADIAVADVVIFSSVRSPMKPNNCRPPGSPS